MSEIGFLASALNGSNKIISQSDADWSSIREGSYFKFVKDNVLYPVANSQEFLYIKDFKVAGTNTVTINENIGINLSVFDTIKISYKEYELLTVFSIEDGGINYQPNDILNIKGGILSSKPETGANQPAQITVLNVDEKGTINKIKIENKGLYLEFPDEIIEVSGGSGQNAKFKVKFKLLDSRSLIEREITEIRMNEDFTELKLNYPIQTNLKEGKLSANKWCLTLAGNYEQGTKVSEKFDIARDFSPNIGLPLLAKNSFSTSEVYNMAMLKLDKEIQAIKDELKKKSI